MANCNLFLSGPTTDITFLPTFNNLSPKFCCEICVKCHVSSTTLKIFNFIKKKKMFQLFAPLLKIKNKPYLQDSRLLWRWQWNKVVFSYTFLFHHQKKKKTPPLQSMNLYLNLWFFHHSLSLSLSLSLFYVFLVFLFVWSSCLSI